MITSQREMFSSEVPPLRILTLRAYLEQLMRCFELRRYRWIQQTPSILVSSLYWIQKNTKLLRVLQQLQQHHSFHCEVLLSSNSEPKIIEIPFDDLNQLSDYYHTYFERGEVNFLLPSNILSSNSGEVIPIHYTQLPYKLTNPLLQFWSFLVGGERFLDLSGFALNELVTGTLQRHHHIQVLDLSNNKLQRLTFHQFTKLQRLNSLNLNHNLFSFLPLSIFALTTLTRLSFSHNNVSQIPNEISLLTNLRTLHADFNDLTSLPHSLTSLTNLDELTLNANKWNSPASIWSTLVSLTSLRSLSLAENEIPEIPVQISLLSQLRYLDCSKNRITFLPETLSALVNLQTLCLGHNQIQSISKSFVKLQNLTRLELNNNKIKQIPLNLWTLLSKKVILILEQNPLPLNFVQHRKMSLKSSKCTFILHSFAFVGLMDRFTPSHNLILTHCLIAITAIPPPSTHHVRDNVPQSAPCLNISNQTMKSTADNRYPLHHPFIHSSHHSILDN
jgi:Leucine-rich repeat (LRR) protein